MQANLQSEMGTLSATAFRKPESLTYVAEKVDSSKLNQVSGKPMEDGALYTGTLKEVPDERTGNKILVQHG
jgi:hypothetical protein